MSFSRDADRIVGENGRLRVAFDANTGAIVSLRNLVTGQELLKPDAARPPWRLLPQGRLAPRARSVQYFAPPGEVPVFEPSDFVATDDGDDLRLSWSAADGIRVEVDVSFEHDDLYLRPRVVVDDGVRPPESLCYPALAGIEKLEGDDRLLFPAHSGLLIADPTNGPGQSGPYPDGFSGCSLQMSAYYATGVGGFSLSTHDGSSTHKGFGFTPRGWEVWHDHYDLSLGSSMDLGYPVVISALTRGDWYEAAEHYRSWAIPNTPWCADGPRHKKVRCSWLHDEVGLTIWGAPSSVDWSDWYRDYTAAAGTPVHICSGWDWPAEHPATTDHWFPARFHPANVEAWKGHYVTPYMNDWFVSVHDIDEWEPELMRPYAAFTWAMFFAIPTIAEGSQNTRVMTHTDFWPCPTSEKFAQLHARRDLTLVTEYGMHGTCYDISCGNPFLRCLHPDHDHPPGWGRGLMEAYVDVNNRTYEAVHQATGTYPALGTECVIENVMHGIDFYCARACGGPLSALEADVGGREKPPGQGRELVPLFDFVYHDYAPVREDVWPEITKRQGDIFFWTSARCVLQWGGILSLHYAINWPGPGHGRDEAEFVAWDGGTYRTNDLPEDDPRKLEFIGELAAARAAYGNKYLGWGRMLPPPDVYAGMVSLNYGFYRDWLGKGLVVQGAWDVPRVISSRWEAADGSVGVFLCNVGDDPVMVEVDSSWGTTMTNREGTSPAPDKVELGPRKIVLFE